MKRETVLYYVRYVGMVLVGCAIFALGFDLFLVPNSVNVGGVTGLAMVIQKLIGTGSLALISASINVPLFIIGYKQLGREFFFGSLLGMVASSIFLEVFLLIPTPNVEPLLATIYGGVLSGIGLGLVFSPGASTGGSDIITRMLKMRFRELKMGRIMLIIDLSIVVLTGIVFQDINKTLYSAITIFASTTSLDTVLYGMDDSSVAIIISDLHDEIAHAIEKKVDRGVTFLNGRGFYSGKDKTVILCAVRKRQVGQLKQAVSSVDPDAFMILQDAHQVLGNGFKRYSDTM